MNTFLKNGHDEYNAIVHGICDVQTDFAEITIEQIQNITAMELLELIQIAQVQLYRNTNQIDRNTKKEEEIKAIQVQLRQQLSNKDLTEQDKQEIQYI